MAIPEILCMLMLKTVLDLVFLVVHDCVEKILELNAMTKLTITSLAVNWIHSAVSLIL